MSNLEIKEMESLNGGDGDTLCGIAIGAGLVLAVASGGWSLVGSAMLCASSAY